ncbi:Rv1733c family protein, partial [Streptomyces alkaliterrae]
RRHNPLRRPVDRIETRARTLLAVLLLAGGGWAAAATGAAAYDAQQHIVLTQTAERTAVTATLTSDANGTTGRLGDNAHRARVVWDDSDGKEHKGVAHVRADARTGDTVEIWIGPDARVTDRPAPASSAPLAGVGA